MATRFISDLAGTLKATFRIAGIVLTNTTDTILEIKNRAGAYLALKASTFRIKSGGAGDTVISTAGSPGTDIPLVLPAAQGASNTVLMNDGSGNMSWASVATANNQVLAQQEVIAWNGGSPITVFTPPANATIRSIFVDVETAYDGSSPSLTVGVAGNTAKYMGSTDSDLTTVGVYEVAPMIEEGASPAAVIVTVVAGAGASAGSARVTVEYSNPA